DKTDSLAQQNDFTCAREFIWLRNRIYLVAQVNLFGCATEVILSGDGTTGVGEGFPFTRRQMSLTPRRIVNNRRFIGY
ncbi:MAG: hypothetical protein ACI4RA_09680, partial [Kiritimatiellia bacterium]